MATMLIIKRSVSLPYDVKKVPMVMRSMSVICPSTRNENDPLPANTDSTGDATRNLLMNADAQLNQFNQLLSQSLGVTPDTQDALNILPGLSFLVKAPDLSIENLNYALFLLTQIQSFLQTSQYHKLAIFIEKSKNAIEQVRTSIQNAKNNIASTLHQQQQQQQQQQYPILSTNSPEVVLSICVVLTDFFGSLNI